MDKYFILLTLEFIDGNRVIHVETGDDDSLFTPDATARYSEDILSNDVFSLHIIRDRRLTDEELADCLEVTVDILERDWMSE